MKGSELPINIMIILIIAVIALIAVVAFFLGTWSPSTENVNIETVKNTACQRFTSARGCEKSAADAITTSGGIGFTNISCNSVSVGNLKDLSVACYGSTAQTICGC